MDGEGHATFAPGQEPPLVEFGYPKPQRRSWKKQYAGLRSEIETITQGMAESGNGGYWYRRLMRALHDH